MSLTQAAESALLQLKTGRLARLEIRFRVPASIMTYYGILYIYIYYIQGYAYTNKTAALSHRLYKGEIRAYTSAVYGVDNDFQHQIVIWGGTVYKQ